jgi:dystrophin
MEPVNENNVDVVKQQFKEHEQYMLQLTSSQGSVGRVLHAGQNLSQKLPEEQAASISNQLVVVNQRWNEVREKAMRRQQALQEQLSRLQRDQLQSISDWITSFEQTIDEHSLLADTVDSCKQQVFLR